MNLLKKLSVFAATTTLLTLGIVVTAPAQASPYKFSFEGDNGVNGYFIFDDSATDSSPRPQTGEYFDSSLEYYFNYGENGIFQGTTGSPIIFLARLSDGVTLLPEGDDFLFEVRGLNRQPSSQFSLENYFIYPKGTFDGSTALRTSVPSTATLTVYPNVDFPNSIGNVLFSETVQTRITPVPEPTSLFAVFGVGTWLILRCRQLKKSASLL